MGATVVRVEKVIGTILGALACGAVGLGFALVREEAFGAMMRGDWDAAETHFKTLAPIALLLDARGIDPL